MLPAQPGRSPAPCPHVTAAATAVDEGEREQGIAHLVEHVTFLGSKKREGLLGTGARCVARPALLGGWPVGSPASLWLLDPRVSAVSMQE